ncbi:DUF808 domain-containing protein [Rubellimicrobium aerolatum]|uniref:DUF808 domain-containing protein n=1 Tax=Rubellimicrobium aerolatum TaxID=490979 RepID=A0ABW0SC11_9RHOB|nr:DUF808 domain-containing protein [Rubellimicrobium aerolatum]MBP1806023.1 putative DNA repair protein MutK [Rubellimicrobium aerolatum]
MASGFFALLDDVAAIAKMAAASLDDVSAQAVKASGKAAGIVIDDTAVTPRYVIGIAAERELSIIWRIALGSLRNKLLLILPGALILAEFLPWLVTPILMAGGAYLCFEGAEKVVERLHPHAAHAEDLEAAGSAEELEARKVSGAIRTDLVLSTEIMVIALATIEASSLLTRAAALALAGVAITVGVYGVVALIVKADDIGAAVARRHTGALHRLGCGLVRGMPRVLAVLSVAGVLAMLWVGGGFLLHGLESFGVEAPEHLIETIAEAAARLAGPIAPIVAWLVGAVGAAVVGLAVGLVLVATLGLVRRMA